MIIQSTPSNLPPTIADIMATVSEVFGVTVDDLLSYRRPEYLASARIVAMAFSRQLTHHTLQEIGSSFSDRDHGTIIHAVKRLPHIENKPRYAQLVQTVRIKLAGHHQISKTFVQTADFRVEFLNSNLIQFSGYTQSLSL